MPTIPMPMCALCSRLLPNDGRPGYRCAAFPDGIPDDIIHRRADHRKPYERDNGIRFEAGQPVPDGFFERLEQHLREINL